MYRALTPSRTPAYGDAPKAGNLRAREPDHGCSRGSRCRHAAGSANLVFEFFFAGSAVGWRRAWRARPSRARSA